MQELIGKRDRIEVVGVMIGARLRRPGVRVKRALHRPEEVAQVCHLIRAGLRESRTGERCGQTRKGTQLHVVWLRFVQLQGNSNKTWAAGTRKVEIARTDLVPLEDKATI